VGREVVTGVTDGAEHAPAMRRGQVSMDELARRKGVRPIDDPASMAYGAFTSDEELDEFLAFVRAARDADLA
jgi:hypothetical protein